MLFLFLLCLIGIWLYYSYLSVKKKSENLLDAFEYVDTALNKRYGLLTDLIFIIQNNAVQEQSLIKEISNLRDKVIDLGLKREFINRRIALDRELEKKTDKLIASLKANLNVASEMDFDEVIKNYAEISNDINAAKKEYNTVAYALRRAVDVFPTSFMARLSNIKSFDYMK